MNGEAPQVIDVGQWPALEEVLALLREAEMVRVVRDGEELAVLTRVAPVPGPAIARPPVPASASRNQRRGRRFTVADIVAQSRRQTTPSFTDEELTTAVAEARAERWRATSND